MNNVLKEKHKDKEAFDAAIERLNNILNNYLINDETELTKIFVTKKLLEELSDTANKYIKAMDEMINPIYCGKLNGKDLYVNVTW